MKKILTFIVLVLIACSCCPLYYQTDVSFYNMGGDEIGAWDDVIIDADAPLRDGRLTFATTDGEIIHISGGTVVMRDIRPDNGEAPIQEKNKLLIEYRELKSEYNENKSLMRDADRGERKILKNRTRIINKRLIEIDNILYTRYYTEIW